MTKAHNSRFLAALGFLGAIGSSGVPKMCFTACIAGTVWLT